MLAKKLNLPFFDFDEEVEDYFKTSIERLQNRCLTSDSYRNELSIVPKRILTENDSLVIALPPSGLRDAYLRVVKKRKGIVVVLEDTPENILKRIRFYDIDSKPIEKKLTDKEKRLYLKDIKMDITYFKKSYQRADLSVDISGLDASNGADKLYCEVVQYCASALSFINEPCLVL